MNSLVSADYGSSSDSTDDANTIDSNKQTNDCTKNFLRTASDLENDSNEDDDDSNSSNECSKSNETKKMVLPSASSILLNGNNSGQVFNNPYKRAEIDQIASLEKHVKMVETDAHTHMKNGKKICWNYRKGRCRFGSSCTYAHDSDLHVPEQMASDKETTYQTKTNATAAVSAAAGHALSTKPPSTVGTTTATIKSTSNKKRPGLGDSIVPSKKVIKSYNALKK